MKLNNILVIAFSLFSYLVAGDEAKEEAPPIPQKPVGRPTPEYAELSRKWLSAYPDQSPILSYSRENAEITFHIPLQSRKLDRLEDHQKAAFTLKVNPSVERCQWDDNLVHLNNTALPPAKRLFGKPSETEFSSGKLIYHDVSGGRHNGQAEWYFHCVCRSPSTPFKQCPKEDYISRLSLKIFGQSRADFRGFTIWFEQGEKPQLAQFTPFSTAFGPPEITEGLDKQARYGLSGDKVAEVEQEEKLTSVFESLDLPLTEDDLADLETLKEHLDAWVKDPKCDDSTKREEHIFGKDEL
ncbi:hypothetical protein B0O99DRAFT_621173 [Bisporella sp. PMI_857]|nr:hypothetical protein B0O99DRAFT_621173 [Bisporella sp. PMI_857]